MLENKNTVRKMKNVLDELISRLDRVKADIKDVVDTCHYMLKIQNIQHKERQTH